MGIKCKKFVDFGRCLLWCEHTLLAVELSALSDFGETSERGWSDKSVLLSQLRQLHRRLWPISFLPTPSNDRHWLCTANLYNLLRLWTGLFALIENWFFTLSFQDYVNILQSINATNETRILFPDYQQFGLIKLVQYSVLAGFILCEVLSFLCVAKILMYLRTSYTNYRSESSEANRLRNMHRNYIFSLILQVNLFCLFNFPSIYRFFERLFHRSSVLSLRSCFMSAVQWLESTSTKPSQSWCWSWSSFTHLWTPQLH